MRTAVLPLLALAPTLSAQHDETRWTYIHDQSAEFISRGSNGGQANAKVSQAFQYGYAANLKTITQTLYQMNDQNLATRETFHAGTCGLDSKGLPDYANCRFYATNLQLPPGTGPGSFTITHRALNSTPHVISENPCAQWHHVWNLVDAANWTTDGLSVFMSQAASYPATNPTRLCLPNASRLAREIPRVDAYTGAPAQIIEELGWSKQQSGSDPVAVDRSWFLFVWFDEIVLKGFSENTIYNRSPCGRQNPGYASIDPNLDDLNGQSPARFDDMVFELRAGTKFANGIGLLFLTNTVIPGGGLPTPFGTLHVNILGLPPGSVDLLALLGPVPLPPLNAQGRAQMLIPLGPTTGAVRKIAADLGTWHAQAAAVTRQGEIKLSSLYTMRTRLVPPGFAIGTAIQSKPLRIPNPGTRARIFLVRNDGRGVLEVQGRRSGQAFGTTTRVCERASAFATLLPGTQEIEFRAPVNNNRGAGNETKFVYRL